MFEATKRFALTLGVFALVGAANRANAELQIIEFGEQTWLALGTGRLLPAGAPLIGQSSPFGAGFQQAEMFNLGNAHTTTWLNAFGGAGSLGTITYTVRSPQIEFSFWKGTAPAVTNLVNIQGDLRGNNGQREMLLAYNLAGNLVASSTVFGRYGQTYSISTPSADIHTVRLIGVDIAAQIGRPALDQPLLGQPAAVPEPSTLALGGIACLLGIAGAYRRRIKNPPLATPPAVNPFVAGNRNAP